MARHPLDISGTTWGDAIQNAVLNLPLLPAKQSAFDAEQRRQALGQAGPTPMASVRARRGKR